MTAMEVVLDIIKLAIPALIVFFTVYTILGRFLDKQYQMKMLEYKEKNQEAALPIRLQAYERLCLFMERISIPALLLRLRSPNMDSKALRYALMVSIQKEYEHNVTQQVYVSNKLWEIIKYTKDDTINVVNLVSDTVNGDAPAEEFAQALLKLIDERKIMTYDKALEAIKKECAQVL
jgi:hypothetical protein